MYPFCSSFVAGVCSLSGVVYCVGGTHGPSGTKYCFRLTEDEKSWERIANLNIGKDFVTADGAVVVGSNFASS